jgi:PBP1b-binding outer membrane lipoprotein LpoB
MKRIIYLLILSSVFLSGCVSTSFGINVSVQDVINKTEPKAIVVLEESQSATFNCIKGALLATRLQTDYVELGTDKLLWQVGSPSFLDQTSINAVYVASQDSSMRIYVTKNMIFLIDELREIGEICAKTPNWQPSEDYWP